MDFPFLEWSVLEQTRFDIFVFFSNLFAEKCFWISFFHSNSLCEGLFLHVLALYHVLCKKIHISLKLRSLFWGHLLSVIGENFFVTIVSNCDIILTWFIFSATLTSNVHTYLVKWKSGSMTTLTSKVFFYPSPVAFMQKCNLNWFLFLFSKIYLLYGQNHL